MENQFIGLTLLVIMIILMATTDIVVQGSKVISIIKNEKSINFLMSSLKDRKKISRSFSLNTNKTEIMITLLDALKESGVNFKSIKQTKDFPGESSDSMQLNLLLQGGFFSVINFFNELSRHHLSWSIYGAEWMSYRGFLRASFQLVLFGIYQDSISHKKSYHFFDPFAIDQVSNNTPSLHSFNYFSIKSLQFIGYEQEGRYVRGIMMLPDGQFVLIKKNDQIGKESVRVIDVNPVEVLLQQNNKIIHIENAFTVYWRNKIKLGYYGKI